ncbi:MAG: aminomethyl-transferring glycine dehydrogenase subunit GcvPA [Clostridiales bacterium]|nr:aminomethyl-transferring glycine dehydrogenase subunit GcvPA [Clostridiales bacterium]
MGNYLPSTPDERQAMLEAIGYTEFSQLFADVPESVLLTEPLAIPSGLSELEVLNKMQSLADQNTVYQLILRGAGAYDHYIPAIVSSVTSREEFQTAYTPYQAEISQGVLQSIFEYQTMICELTGMDVSNASVYDGASAAAEATLMCVDRRRKKVVVAGNAHPDVVATIRTYCWARGLPFEVVPARDGLMDADSVLTASTDAACVYFQQPNFLGLIEDAPTIVEAAHTAGAKAIMGVNPIALGLLKSPGECGADIAVGEGQPLGLPLSYGGPYLGFMACKKQMMRSLPGRIAGETKDKQGRRAYVLTLQAREQHIRREKAGSNLCTNQALCAMAVAVYLGAMGSKGLAQAAQLSHNNAHYFADQLTNIPGYALVHDAPFFHEFLTSSPVSPEKLEQALVQKGILSGLPVGENILWCVTEKATRALLDQAISIIREVHAQ